MKKILLFLKRLPIKYYVLFLALILIVILTISLIINNSFRKYTVEFFKGIPLVVDGDERCLVGVDRQFGNYHFAFGYLSYLKDSMIISKDGEEESFNPAFIYFINKNTCPLLDKTEAVGDDILKLYRYDSKQQTGWFDYIILGKKFKYAVESIKPVEEKNKLDAQFFYFKVNDHIQIKMDRDTRKYVEVKDVFDQIIKGVYFVAGKGIYIEDDQDVKEYNLGDCQTCIYRDKYTKVFSGADNVGSFLNNKYLAINNKLFEYSSNCKKEVPCNPENRLKEIVLSAPNSDIKSDFKYKNIRLGNYVIKDGYLYYQKDTNRPLSIKDLILLSNGPANFNVINSGGDDGFRLISSNILKLIGVSETGPVYLFGNFVDAGLFYDTLKYDGITYDGGFEPVELKDKNTPNLLHFLFTPNLEVVINLEKENIEDYTMYNYSKKYKNDLFLVDGNFYMKINNSIPSEVDSSITGFIKLAQGVKDFKVNESDESLIEIDNVIYKRQPTGCDKDGNNCLSYSLVEISN